jgi:hypothetical protein
MDKFYVKLLLIALGVAFCIFFGVDLGGRGIDRTQGTRVQTTVQKTVSTIPATKPIGTGNKPDNPAGSGAAGEKSEIQEKKEPNQEQPRAENVSPSGISRIGIKTGELLQITAYHGIRWFVALFEAVT